jgi:hypothetical protein
MPELKTYAMENYGAPRLPSELLEPACACLLACWFDEVDRGEMTYDQLIERAWALSGFASQSGAIHCTLVVDNFISKFETMREREETKHMTEETRMLTTCCGPKPEVGMGATLVVGSDNYPMTVVAVHGGGRSIELQYDDAKRVDKNGLSEIQEWKITPNPTAQKVVATKRRNGAYRLRGEPTRVLLGSRRMYRDPSF